MSENKDSIEFYDGDMLLFIAKSSMVPLVGSLINIKLQVWKVKKVTYALDHADDYFQRAMRANVDLIKMLD